MRVGRAITPPEARSIGLTGGLPQAMPSASAVAAAAATAKIQAMDAVATNMGVDASQLVIPAPPPVQVDWRDRQIRKCGLPRDELGRPIKAMSQITNKKPRSRSRSRDRRSPRRDRDRDSRGHDRSRDDKKSSRDRSRSRDRVKREKAASPPPPPAPAGVPAPPAPRLVETPLQLGGLPQPPTIPASSFMGTTTGGMSEAQDKALQLEVDKKLQDEGEAVTLKQQEDMSIRGKTARQMVMQRLMGARERVESGVLLLRNMVGPEDVDEELQEEIQQECGKYGKVENVIIYQEKQDDSDEAEVRVKIFVEFSDSIETKKAKNSLDGRFFGGRTISAHIYDQELYDQQDFSA